jgi:hypothetical protein
MTFHYIAQLETNTKKETTDIDIGGFSSFQ